MKDTSNTAEDLQKSSDGITPNKKVDELHKDSVTELPANRVIRKRLAARTIGVHLSALPPELHAFKASASDMYLAKYDLPDEVPLTVFGGDRKVFSRNEVWELADKAGEKLEWDMLPDNIAGKATALFSTTGQGIYANYGRPTMDFSSFFYDYGAFEGLSCACISPQGQSSVLLGPIFITVDTVSAAGFTALGHLTRSARLTDKTVLADITSTGVYEGTTSWASAKLGVLTGAKAIRLAAALPIPGAHLAAVPVGFLVGASTAIFVKYFANKSKDSAIDATHHSIMSSKASKAARGVVPA